MISRLALEDQWAEDVVVRQKNRSLYAKYRHVRLDTPNGIGGVATAMIFDEKIIFPANAITKTGFCTYHRIRR